MYSRGTRILAAGEGKERRIVGHSAMFLLERTRGQHNFAIDFKEAPWEEVGGGGGWQKNRKTAK